MRAAVMGTGLWARMAHLPALRALPDVDVIACVGATAAEARAFADEHAVAGAYGSLDDLFASEHRPELLAVVAPDDVHAAATTVALEAGVAVLCEKPLANDVAAAEALAALAARTGTPATVGYSFRFSPAIRRLSDDLAAGRLGVPWLIELHEHNPQFHPRTGKTLNWKGDPEHAAAGALFEYGSHVVDLAEHLVGPVAAVSTTLAPLLPNARLDDVAVLQLRFANGAAGTLVASWLLPGGFPGIRIRLSGSEATVSVTVDDAAGGERYELLAPDGTIAETVVLPAPPHPVSGYAELHYREFVRLVGSAVEPSVSLPTLADGARVQRVLEAALQATERWQEIPPPALAHEVATR